jgi:hypothetical protein
MGGALCSHAAAGDLNVAFFRAQSYHPVLDVLAPEHGRVAAAQPGIKQDSQRRRLG